jgi:hypothetical protein
MADKFPKPYVNSVKTDKMMEYVPMDTLSIGARKSGMPKGMKPEGMGLDHVGSTAGGAK